MKVVNVVWGVLGIVLTGALSFVLKDSLPEISGVLAGMSLFLILCEVIGIKWGAHPIGSIISRTTILKLGVWPIIVFGVSAALLIYSLSSRSFLLCFLGTLAFVVSFMLVSLGIVARNPANK